MKHYIYSLQKAQLLFALAFCIFLAMPCKMHAEEVEIPLIEVSGIGFIPGDDPLDGPEQSVPEPPQPTEFRASIDGSTLAITSGTHSARVIVRDNTGTSVLDRQFVGGTMEQLSTPGAYSLEIQSGTLTLVGMFEAQ